MPRHIRSVTARRPRRIAKPVKEAPPPAAPAAPSLAAELSNEAELFDALRQAFQVTPGIPETPERTRERYAWAIESLANYLEDIGADTTWVERIEELGWALEDLTTGVVAPFLKPGPPPGPGPSSPA
jgi:hypothetical protein